MNVFRGQVATGIKNKTAVALEMKAQQGLFTGFALRLDTKNPGSNLGRLFPILKLMRTTFPYQSNMLAPKDWPAAGTPFYLSDSSQGTQNILNGRVT